MHADVGPLPECLRDVCEALPHDLSALPESIRTSAESLRAAANQGNAGGLRRHRRPTGADPLELGAPKPESSLVAEWG